MTDERTPYDFPPPTSIQDAESRILELSWDVRGIEAQLSNKNRQGENGKRVSDHDYHSWRRRAITAKLYKEAELAYVRQWVREQNRKVQELLACERFRFDKDDPVSLLAAAYKLLKDLINSGTQVTKEEQALMDVVRDYLKGAM